MLTRIVSFYQGNIPKSIIQAQAAVFEKFGYKIEQVLTASSHGAAIDHYVRSVQFDVLLIFDVDCIPLDEQVIPDAIDAVAHHPCLYGIRQNANQFPGTPDYVGPAFVCFSRDTFKALGSPSFRSSRNGDVGSRLTYNALNPGLLRSLLQPSIEVRFLNVADAAVPKWFLSDGTQYGLGTNYEQKIFHAFGIGSAGLSRNLFLEKAAGIVGHSGWPQSCDGEKSSVAARTNNIPVYVISLPDAEIRRRNIADRLGSLGIQFSFVDAIDGRRPLPDRLGDTRIVREAFDTEQAVARSMSHRLVHRMIKGEVSDLALVLEDDAKLAEHFSTVLADITTFEFDVLKLEGRDYDRRRVRVGSVGGYAVIVRRTPSRGSTAYLIRRSAATRLCSLPVIDRSVDVSFDDPKLLLRVLELEPFPVVQEAPRCTFKSGPRPRKLEKFLRSVRRRKRLIQLHGFRVALALDLQRFQSRFDRD
jgi:GR25 family glycosyltransferase involved in LPS biosynthesis